MILSQRQLEEIAASTTKDFNRFFFGDEADKPDRSALPTPIDQFAKNYLGLRVSFARLSPDGSICGVTAYADTEYKITELGIIMNFLLNEAKRQDIGTILTRDTSRISRDTSSFIRFERKFRENGIRFEYLSKPDNELPVTPMMEAFETAYKKRRTKNGKRA